MKAIFGVALCVLALPNVSMGQTAKEPTISKDPLTGEQISVYRAFLRNYDTGLNAPINVSDVTDEFKPDQSDLKSCLKEFATVIPPTGVHRFNTEFADLKKIHLVDPATHKTSDPGDAIKRGDSVENAVKAGFAAGVLTLSEIVFDPPHHLAAFTYSFYCGSLCGNGGTVVFELQNGKWVKSKRFCSFWMS